MEVRSHTPLPACLGTWALTGGFGAELALVLIICLCQLIERVLCGQAAALVFPLPLLLHVWESPGSVLNL